MAAGDVKGTGTSEDPWVLKSPPGTSVYQMWKDEEADPPTLMCKVGTTMLSYQLRCLNDLQKMLEDHGDWMLLGRRMSRSRRRAERSSVGALSYEPGGGWYGMKKDSGDVSGCTSHPDGGARPRGGRAQPRNNRMRAL
jgi:hypothetical protein